MSFFVILRFLQKTEISQGVYSSLRAIGFCIFAESNSWPSTHTTKSCHTEALKKPKYPKLLIKIEIFH
ncbi:hypothetical protein [Helicobacter sp. T3_23-1059]